MLERSKPPAYLQGGEWKQHRLLLLLHMQQLACLQVNRLGQPVVKVGRVTQQEQAGMPQMA